MILDFARDEAEETGRGVLVADAAAEESVDATEEGVAVEVKTTVAIDGPGGSLNLQLTVSSRSSVERQTNVAVTKTAEPVTVDVVGATEATLAMGAAVTEATALGM